MDASILGDYDVPASPTPEERVADFNEWLHGIREYRLGPLERKHLAADFRAAEQAMATCAESYKRQAKQHHERACRVAKERDTALKRVADLEQEIADWKGG